MGLIVGIDPSLNSTGVVVLNQAGNPVKYETINPWLEGMDRLNYNFQRYKALFTSYPDITCVAFERQVDAQRYNYNAKNILSLAENIGILKLAIHELKLTNKDITVLAFSPDQVKQFAVGKCRGIDKQTVIDSLPEKILKAIKQVIQDDAVNDVADAYYVARKAFEMMKQGDDIAPYLQK